MGRPLYIHVESWVKTENVRILNILGNLSLLKTVNYNPLERNLLYVKLHVNIILNYLENSDCHKYLKIRNTFNVWEITLSVLL